ncbi:MAG: peptidoglycan-associated lipoprotein Pal [Acidobacteriota bacterium]
MRTSNKSITLVLAAMAVIGWAAAGCQARLRGETPALTAPEPDERPLRSSPTETVRDPFGSAPAAEGPIEEEITEENLRPLSASGEALESQMETLYFAFDQSSLTTQSRTSLDHNVTILLQHPDLRIRITGHCDERGTVEYNLALGDRRASTAREYMVERGVSRSRMETVSYGEERPADPGHTESAWARNRRVEFHVIP